MAGHSKWSNIKHRKAGQDAKRAKVFTKIIRELTVSARDGGGNIDDNAGLRTVVDKAKSAQMPKDTMERAIARGAGGQDGAELVALTYEGYGPGGVAVIVETLTDNRNRTASEVRAAFTKHGGSLGETNSVSFQFDRIGAVGYPADVTSVDEMFEAALEAGATDVVSSEESHDVVCEPDDLHAVREALEAKFDTPQLVELQWKPQVVVPVGEDHVQTLFKLLETLDDNDDVRSVSANYEVDDAVMATLAD